MKSLLFGISVVAGTLVAGVASLPRDARACGGEWGPAVYVPPSEEAISQAEKLLSHDRYFTAALLVHHEYPYLSELTAATDGLQARAQRVMAIAVMRMDGNLTLGEPWRGWSAPHRKANLSWAVNTLYALHEAKQDDPLIMSYLGEGLAKLPEGRTEAVMILSQLASNDLLATPQGYRALAELRQEAGDESGRDDATKRCTAMAGGTASCQLPSS